MRGFSGSFFAQSARPVVSKGWVKAERKSVSGKTSVRMFKNSAAPPAANPTGEPKNIERHGPRQARRLRHHSRGAGGNRIESLQRGHHRLHQHGGLLAGGLGGVNLGDRHIVIVPKTRERRIHVAGRIRLLLVFRERLNQGSHLGRFLRVFGQLRNQVGILDHHRADLLHVQAVRAEDHSHHA